MLPHFTPFNNFHLHVYLGILLPAIISQPGHSSEGGEKKTNSNYAFHHQMLSFYCSCDWKTDYLQSRCKRLLQHNHRSSMRHYQGPCNQLHFSQNCCISRNDNDPLTLNQHITAEKLFRIRPRSFVFQDGTSVFIRLQTIIKLEEINFTHITLCRKLCIGC